MHDWLDTFTRMAANELGTTSSTWLSDWMTDGQADEITRVNGRAVARYGRRVKIVFRALCGMFAAFAIIALLLPGSDKWIAVPFVLMLLATAWWLAMLTVEQIDFDRTDIHLRRLWQDDVTFPWSQIQSVDYSDLRSSYVLNFGTRGQIRVGVSISGCMVVVHMARAMARQNREQRR